MCGAPDNASVLYRYIRVSTNHRTSLPPIPLSLSPRACVERKWGRRNARKCKEEGRDDLSACSLVLTTSSIHHRYTKRKGREGEEKPPQGMAARHADAPSCHRDQRNAEGGVRRGSSSPPHPPSQRQMCLHQACAHSTRAHTSIHSTMDALATPTHRCARINTNIDAESKPSIREHLRR